MKVFTKSLVIAAAISATLSLSAENPKIGMLIGYKSTVNENPQETEAAQWFLTSGIDGNIIYPNEVAEIDANKYDCIWIHIDRLGMGKGVDRLPEAFANPTTLNALKKYVADGGNLYLSKHATQLVVALGRLPESHQLGIFGDGDGGRGTDVWCVNAHLGSWQLNPDNADPDASQVYDRRAHDIYKGMESYEPWSQWGNFPHASYPMLGTGDGSEIHREDHNCMWDLNAYSYTTEGKNTLEKFESMFDCTVLGTWGHVQDYCVAGIVDFEPTAEIKGRIVANGLAACEWAPRTGNNKYAHNLKTLTANTLTYLAKGSTSGVESIEASAHGEAVYYNFQGVKVAYPEKGMYIKVVDGKATKVFVK